MKILLINPPILSLNPVISSLFFNSPPLGILYIAAVLEKNEIDVQVIDAALERLSISSLIDKVLLYEPDIVGITSTTFSFSSAKELAKQIKIAKPDIKIVIGGSHVSAVPEDVLSNECFDFGVIGEGELTFLELIQNINQNSNFLKDIEGIVYRDGNSNIIQTPPRPLIENLDILPFPARHLVPIHKYKPQPNDKRDIPKISLISSRGCPYQCIFCGKSVFGTSYRSFSAKYIIAEMKYVMEQFGAKDIAFVDSLFMVSLERVKGICQEILENNLKISWTCTIRANVIKEKYILQLMKDSGCWRIRIGIESGSEKILKLIKKEIDLSHLQKVVAWADEIKLQPKGFFMIGHFTENINTIKESITLAKSLPLKDITLQINTPLPNTEQFKICQIYGRLFGDLTDCSLFKPIFTPNDLSTEELEYWFNRFYREFYLRPVIILRHLKYIRNLKDIIKYIQAFNLIIYLFFINRRINYVSKKRNSNNV
ncbi:MAG: radical SAM protein [Endomicrobiaceae bacterium]|nr:radical SAM protein [Endomicrobiaceae bacterium]